MSILKNDRGSWQVLLKVSKAKFRKTRFNVWELFNETIIPDFEIEVAPGKRYRPKLVMSFSVREPKKQAMKARSRDRADRLLNQVFKETGVLPCQ